MDPDSTVPQNVDEFIHQIQNMVHLQDLDWDFHRKHVWVWEKFYDEYKKARIRREEDDKKCKKCKKVREEGIVETKQIVAFV